MCSCWDLCNASESGPCCGRSVYYAGQEQAVVVAHAGLLGLLAAVFGGLRWCRPDVPMGAGLTGVVRHQDRLGCAGAATTNRSCRRVRPRRGCGRVSSHPGPTVGIGRGAPWHLTASHARSVVPARDWAKLQWCTTAFVTPHRSDDSLAELARRVHHDVDPDPAGYEGSKQDQVLAWVRRVRNRSADASSVCAPQTARESERPPARRRPASTSSRLERAALSLPRGDPASRDRDARGRGRRSPAVVARQGVPVEVRDPRGHEQERLDGVARDHRGSRAASRSRPIPWGPSHSGVSRTTHAS